MHIFQYGDMVRYKGSNEMPVYIIVDKHTDHSCIIKALGVSYHYKGHVYDSQLELYSSSFKERKKNVSETD